MRDGEGPDGEPSDPSSGDEGPQAPDNFGNPGGPEGYHVDPDFMRPAHDALEQEYARRSRSTQPQQLVEPIMTPRFRPGRINAQIAQSHGQVPSNIPPDQGPQDADHEINMINNLMDHIRNSLMGVPDNLPEIKGLRAKLPEAYEGEDDFDRLDKWLQGLLHFFKLHRITG